MKTPNPVAVALMLKMQIAPEDHRRVTLECLDLFASLKLKPSHYKLISDLILSHLKLTTDEMKDLEIDISGLDMPKQEAIMEIITGWKKEQFEQGREQGREQGHEHPL